ncbi:MAG TPA: hypothetical protein PKD03_10175 [Ignavibacteriaceae bacterium]|nr:hypothetical protein [Ignavibacteriaceae bacterium]
MKKYIILDLLMVVLLFSNQTFSQTNSSGYDYPIKPGTQEWKNLKNHGEMIEACQIPSPALDKMSTKSLIESCLNYPLFIDIFAFNNFQAGFERVFKSSNVFQELYKRKNVAVELLNYYRALKIEDPNPKWTPIELGD